MRRVPFVPNSVLLLGIVLVATGIYVAQGGYVSARYLPLPALDLKSGTGWFIDWRLAALNQDRALCTAVLTGPEIEAAPVADRPRQEGCGWINAVRVERVGGASLGVEPLTCPVAAAFALWVNHVVQPAAEKHLGSRVTGIRHLGTYSCRRIVGGFWGKYGKYLEKVDPGASMSQHASANAIDIGGFRLANGDTVSVLKDWPGEGAKARFLRVIHEGACRYFRVTLGPDANKEHRDHFHFDRGFLRSCR